LPAGTTVIPIFAALADPQRARMLRLLERDELAVGELASALQLPQSTMSRHLKALHEVAIVSKRSEGTATLYRFARETISADARAAWELLRASLGDHGSFADDDRRLIEVIASRNTDSKGFFGRVGGEWSGLRRSLFGERFDSEALLSLLPAEWAVADLGCGTGDISAEIAPFLRKVVAIDREPAMIDAARKRLREHANVEVRKGSLEELPATAGEFDACVISLVLHHVPAPAKVLVAARKALAKHGSIIVIDMVAHTRSEYRTAMGHEHLGFSQTVLAELASEAKLKLALYRPLRPAIDARGPGLFVARLTK
jgi:ArsR family transcriptional regulator